MQTVVFSSSASAIAPVPADQDCFEKIPREIFEMIMDYFVVSQIRQEPSESNDLLALLLTNKRMCIMVEDYLAHFWSRYYQPSLVLCLTGDLNCFIPSWMQSVFNELFNSSYTTHFEKQLVASIRRLPCAAVWISKIFVGLLSIENPIYFCDDIRCISYLFSHKQLNQIRNRMFSEDCPEDVAELYYNFCGTDPNMLPDEVLGAFLKSEKYSLANCVLEQRLREIPVYDDSDPEYESD